MKYKTFFLFMYILNFNTAICDEIKFVNGIDDIPIFENMENNDDSLVVFDTNKGRFISSEIIGKNDLKKIESFYEKVLPNLGWKKLKYSTYIRDDEVLNLELKILEGKVHLMFKITPK